MKQVDEGDEKVMGGILVKMGRPVLNTTSRTTQGDLAVWGMRLAWDPQTIVQVTFGRRQMRDPPFSYFDAAGAQLPDRTANGNTTRPMPE